VLFVGVIIAVVYPISIQGALKRQSYKIIEKQQDVVLSNVNQLSPNSTESFIKSRNAARSVSHLVITPQQQSLNGDTVADKVLNEMAKNAGDQHKNLGEYELSYQGANLFYVVQKFKYGGKHVFLISYMWDTYRNQMVKTLWVKLLWV